MGLIIDLQSDLKEAFDDDLSDVVVEFQIVKNELIGNYDADKGERSVAPSVYYSRGVFGVVSNRIVNDSIKSTDETITVIANEILDENKVAGFIDFDDKILLSDGTVYIVIDPRPVMGGGTTPIIFEAVVRKNG